MIICRRDTASSTDLSQLGTAAVELGLPELDPAEIATCGGPGAQPCTPAGKCYLTWTSKTVWTD